MLHSSVMGFL